MVELRYTSLRGAEIRPFLVDLARLRIGVFAEYPYLYDGEVAYEEHYLSFLAACPRSVLVLAQHGEQVVGCATGLPLADADADFQAPFAQAGLPVAAYYYFGESVLDPAYRGLGAGKAFFAGREAAARSEGATWATFCAVERPADHPARPAHYRPHDAWWSKLGFVKQPDLRATFSWKEHGQTTAIDHAMTYWVKSLA